MLILFFLLFYLNKVTVLKILKQSKIKESKIIKALIYYTKHIKQNYEIYIKYQENQKDKEGDLNDKEYINNYFSRYKQAETIYTILNQKTKKYFENLNKYVHRVNKSQKKIIFGLSPFPNISMNRELRFQDSTNKSVTLYNKSFGSAAIGERYERHMSELLKLKQILKNIKEKDDKKRKKMK